MSRETKLELYVSDTLKYDQEDPETHITVTAKKFNVGRSRLRSRVNNILFY